MNTWIKLILHKIGNMKIKKIILTKSELLIIFHIMVVIINIITIIRCILYFFIYNGEKTHHLEFVKHGRRYAPFMVSLQSMASQFTSLNLYALLDIIDIFSIRLSDERKEFLLYTANFLLFTFAFPLSMTVGVGFWSLYFYDKQTIYPDALESLLPSELNQILHTVPMILTPIYVATRRRLIPSKSSTFASLLTFLLSYGVCIITIKCSYGVWIYMAFEAFTSIQMGLILLFCFVWTLMFHHIGYVLHEFVIGSPKKGLLKVFDNGLGIWIPVW